MKMAFVFRTSSNVTKRRTAGTGRMNRDVVSNILNIG